MRDSELRGFILDALYDQRRKGLVNLDQELGGLPVARGATESILRQLVKKGLVERPFQPLSALGNGRITAYGIAVVQGTTSPPLSILLHQRITVQEVQVDEGNIQNDSDTKVSVPMDHSEAIQDKPKSSFERISKWWKYLMERFGCRHENLEAFCRGEQPISNVAPLRIATIGSGKALADGEAVAVGRERLVELALRHQHVADPVVRDRQIALPPCIATIGSGETLGDGLVVAVGPECLEQIVPLASFSRFRRASSSTKRQAFASPRSECLRCNAPVAGSLCPQWLGSAVVRSHRCVTPEAIAPHRPLRC